MVANVANAFSVRLRFLGTWVILVTSAEVLNADAPMGRPFGRCGPLALQVCSEICGRPLSPERLDSTIAAEPDGCALLDLARAAESLRLCSLTVRWSVDPPSGISAPAIIPVVNRSQKLHFIVLAGCRDGQALIVDPPADPAWMSTARLRSELHWGGEALHVARDDEGLAGVKGAVAATRRRKAVGWSLAGAAALTGAWAARRGFRTGSERGRDGARALR